MPYISTEALVGTLLLIALAVGYQYLPKASEAKGSRAGKKRNKKKSKSTAVEESSAGSASRSAKVQAKSKSAQLHENGHETIHSKASNNHRLSISEETADINIAHGATGNNQQSSKPRTLAEKLGPKVRKTRVDE